MTPSLRHKSKTRVPLTSKPPLRSGLTTCGVYVGAVVRAAAAHTDAPANAKRKISPRRRADLLAIHLRSRGTARGTGMRELRKLRDQAVHDFHVALDTLVLLAHLVRGELVLRIEQHVRRGMHDGQRSAQVVRHLRQHCFQALRFFVHSGSRSFATTFDGVYEEVTVTSRRGCTSGRRYCAV